MENTSRDPRTALRSIGLIGAGAMGHGIGKNIVESGFALRVVAHRRRQTIDDLVARGATEDPDIAALVAASSTILTCLPTLAAIESTLSGIIGSAAPGTIVIDCSTNDPAVAKKLHARALNKGIRLLEAPIMKGPKDAWAGTINFISAGDQEVFEAVRPLLECAARNVFYVGGAGNGHTMKLLNNFVSISSHALACEAFVAARALGIDPARMRDIVLAGNGGSNVFRKIIDKLLDGDESVNATLDIFVKDLSVYRRLVADRGLDRSISATIGDLYRMTAERRSSLADNSALADVLSEGARPEGPD